LVLEDINGTGSQIHVRREPRASNTRRIPVSNATEGLMRD
jgi:hypothetical protein